MSFIAALILSVLYLVLWEIFFRKYTPKARDFGLAVMESTGKMWMLWPTRIISCLVHAMFLSIWPVFMPVLMVVNFTITGTMHMFLEKKLRKPRIVITPFGDR